MRRSEGNTRYLMRVLPYRGRQNVIEGVVVTFFDITKLVEAEARQRTMVEELNHRVRNMLTVVAAIANQTLAKSASPEQFAEAFLGRIQSLAMSYGLLSRDQWGDVLLQDILNNELGQFREGTEERIALEGPLVAFKPNAALALGLVFHELATNATKYGALSRSDAKISVSWNVESSSARTLVLTWRETGGPRVHPPARKGFGTELMEREVGITLGGQLTLEYLPDGLVAQIAIPFITNNIPLVSQVRG